MRMRIFGGDVDSAACAHGARATTRRTMISLAREGSEFTMKSPGRKRLLKTAPFQRVEPRRDRSTHACHRSGPLAVAPRPQAPCKRGACESGLPRPTWEPSTHL